MLKSVCSCPLQIDTWLESLYEEIFYIMCHFVLITLSRLSCSFRLDRNTCLSSDNHGSYNVQVTVFWHNEKLRMRFNVKSTFKNEMCFCRIEYVLVGLSSYENLKFCAAYSAQCKWRQYVWMVSDWCQVSDNSR